MVPVNYTVPDNYIRICLNGHISAIGSSARLRALQAPPNFCDECGAEIISNCSSCDSGILAKVVSPGYRSRSKAYKPPAYCPNCGQPYPWTQKRLDALQSLTSELEELSNEERRKLMESLPDIVADTPKTNAAASFWKRTLGKAAGYTGDAIRQILVDIASETAKKILFPGP